MDGHISFFLSSFPELPAESVTVMQTLDKLKQKSLTYKRIKPKRQYSVNRRRGKTSLNGFMAYRAYYSKDVDIPKLQIELSRLLASYWKKTKNQQVWNRYAQEFNASTRSLPFLEWLNEALRDSKKEDIMIIKEKSWSQKSKLSNLVVEDVFYTKQ